MTPLAADHRGPLVQAQSLAKSQEHRGGRGLIRVLRDHQRPRHGLDVLPWKRCLATPD